MKPKSKAKARAKRPIAKNQEDPGSETAQDRGGKAGRQKENVGQEAAADKAR
jgi:hypothetical protein